MSFFKLTNVSEFPGDYYNVKITEKNISNGNERNYFDNLQKIIKREEGRDIKIFKWIKKNKPELLI